MKATLKKEEGLLREFEVTIPANDIETRKSAELIRIGKEAKFDGFRPGKVPAEVIKKKYGESVDADILNKVVQESLTLTLTENKLRPAMEPSVKAENKLEDGKDFKYNFSVEIFPEVPKVDYSKIEIESQIAEVGEDDIKEAIKRITAANKDFAPIKDKRAIKKGDMVDFDFEGKKDDVPFDGGTSEGFRLEIGSGQFIPGFEDAMIGLKAGDEKDIPLTFPEEYHSPDLAGADVVFSVKVNDILEEKEVEVNEEFAKKFGFDDVDGLKKAITEQIEKDFADITFTKTKKNLFDILDKECAFEVPKGMVDADKVQIAQQMKAENPESKDKDIEEEAETLAERRVRLGILLAELGREENVKVSEDEIRQNIFAKAQAYPGQEMQIIEFYQKNQQAIEQIKGEIVENKVVKLVIEKVKVKEKKVSREELLAEEHVHGPDCNHGADHDDEDKPKNKSGTKAATKKKTSETKTKKDEK